MHEDLIFVVNAAGETPPHLFERMSLKMNTTKESGDLIRQIADTDVSSGGQYFCVDEAELPQCIVFVSRSVGIMQIDCSVVIEGGEESLMKEIVEDANNRALTGKYKLAKHGDNFVCTYTQFVPCKLNERHRNETVTHYLNNGLAYIKAFRHDVLHRSGGSRDGVQ